MSEFAVFLSSMILLSIFTVVCIAIDLVSYARKRRLIKPVEFFPPEGFSPLDAALVYSARGMRTSYILNPLLLYWVDKGYVSVEEDGRGLKVNCLKTPPSFEESGRARKKTYNCEMKIFAKMFDGDEEYYSLAAEKSVSDEYEKALEELKGMSRSVIGKKGKRISLIMKLAAAALAFIVGILVSVYSHLPIVLMMLFPVIGAFLMKFMPAPVLVRVPFMAVWGGVPLLALLFLIPIPTLLSIAVGTAILVLLLTICVFAENTDFREKKDLKIYAKVCSFRRFLIVADKKRLEMLVEQYPRYFYDVLPYFYVFGITRKMKSKFDKIVPDGSLRQLGALRDIYVD